MATYYALDALDALGALHQPLPGRRRAAIQAKPLADGLQIFSCQIQAHGTGSPAEAVLLASSLRIHLWGAKNAEPQWIARAQEIAEAQQVPVIFFRADEEYGTWVNVPGLGTYSHTSDLIAPAEAEIGESLANRGPVSWQEFRRHRLQPLQKADGRLFWQFGENEELTRLFLDDSLERGGYAAISTFHFGNPDFTNSEAFLKRYAGQLPFISLQDAHGSEPWWFADITTGFRTLFLAREANWDGWLSALRNNWVAAVRHDAVTGFQTRMHAGSEAVVEFLMQRQTHWRWWDNPTIQRPLVSLVALYPHDRYEAGRPEQGVNLRIRCAHHNTNQGQPTEPIVELVSLSVNGSDVAPERVSAQSRRGNRTGDIYYLWRMPDAAEGKYSATAMVRLIKTRSQASQAISFTLPESF